MKLRKSHLNSGGNFNGPCPCDSRKNFRHCCAREKNPINVFNSLVTKVWGHIQANQLKEAENLCWRLLELYPNYPDLLHFLGIIAFHQKVFEKAVSLLRKAVAFAPNNAGYRSSLGNILRAMNCLEESLQQLQIGATLAPDLAPIHLNMGIVLKTLNRQEEAIHCYHRALALVPDFVEAHFNLGILLQDQNRFLEAEAAYRQALRIKPDYAELHTNLGNLLKDLKRFEEAEEAYRYALHVKPDFADAYSNLGTLLKELKRFNEAEAAYRQALCLKPDFADANWNLSLLYLSLGRFQEGWLLYEERYNPDRKERSSIPIQVPFPMWRGEDLMGKSLLIIPEQGFGDQIQFCRYTAELRSRGARQITLVCDKSLKSLFASLAGVDRVLVSEQMGDDLPHDYWTFFLSIPLHIGTTLANIPAKIPYLSAPADRLTRWSNFLPQQGLRVGLVWR
ncbi:MAG: tetratricopeptide repeat protein, partial [Magnetococcales bacterium]|nr:tetratricopeptide repeat protein [Magnetococcales bacterium]